jgi:predicted MPP superfamily phosphohydrolase
VALLPDKCGPQPERAGPVFRQRFSIHAAAHQNVRFDVTRRKFGYAFLAASGVAAAYPCYFEPRWLTVTRPVVKLSRSQLREPVRILHLSDLHLSIPVPLSLIDAAVDLGLNERPDVICLTGDLITGRRDLSSGEYARTLSRLAGAAPTFAVLGNHDGGSWASEAGGFSDTSAVRHMLEASGIRLLHNASVHVQVRTAGFSVVGVGDLWADEVAPKTAFSGVDLGEPTLLLAHNPDTKDTVATYTWDLLLSGHTHGGQVLSV